MCQRGGGKGEDTREGTDLDLAEAFDAEAAEGAQAEVGQLEVEGVVVEVGEDVLVVGEDLAGDDLVALSGRLNVVVAQGWAHDELSLAFDAALVVLEVALVELEVGKGFLCAAVRDVAAVRL